MLFGSTWPDRDYSSYHICGCHFIVDQTLRYLPQVELKSHSLINPISFTTQLVQTFHNPNSAQLSNVRYVFPLYDGVSVNGYEIRYGDQHLHGVVKQKDDAKQTYQAAVDRGESAGLLEALPAGVFGVTLGNVPPKTDIVVTISYCGELKHDAGIDGLRWTLPTSIAPRYGSYPGSLLSTNAASKGGLSITVDVDMAASNIRKVQSPSHPISVSMGELSAVSTQEKASFSPSRASVTLSQGTAELQGDFVLQINVDDINKPQAILETHSSIADQRALMTTLVPRFNLESAHPEIIFIADQSGSMRGPKNQALVAALKIFLKSLPFGVRFNICAFGNSFQFLWPKSQAYNEENLQAATSFVETFGASLGGTELLHPVKAAFERHLQDLPLEIMLLTDGAIWAEDQLFEFVNDQIVDKKVDARVFALGIGNDVSHTLVEGIARAGNGFSQFVTQGEDVDRKVIRMLKGALYAHTKDYELEVNYADEDSLSDDEYEIVEKVNDCLALRDRGNSAEDPSVNAVKKSFFDPSAASEDTTEMQSKGADRYAHLPTLDTPAILQAPASIPPLFPFNRTTIYLLLGLDSPRKKVSSVTLRATSAAGPLELEIPVTSHKTGTSVHQLAARSAIQDLEEGRGWLQHATLQTHDDKKIRVKEKYENRFDELVEREGVRLGETFQVASKWTSFVAVDANNVEQTKSTSTAETRVPRRQETSMVPGAAPALRSAGSTVSRLSLASTSPAMGAPQQLHHAFGASGPMSMNQQALPFGGAPFAGFGPVQAASSFGTVSQQPLANSFSGGSSTSASSQLSSSRAQMQASMMSQQSCAPNGLFAGKKKMPGSGGASLFGASATVNPPLPPPASNVNAGVMHKLISLQTFSGAWMWSDQLLKLIRVDGNRVDRAKFSGDGDVAATALAVAYLERKVSESKDVWEMVVGKARAWLGKQVGDEEGKVNAMVEAAANCLADDEK